VERGTKNAPVLNMNTTSSDGRPLAAVAKLLAALALLGAAACTGEIDPREPSPSTAGNDTSDGPVREDGETTGTVSQALPIGGGGGSSCSAPPLQCGGRREDRGIYPGCSVSCKVGETAMCLPGSCFWHTAANCTCQGAIYYPQ
jgi:hypothetical protein